MASIHKEILIHARLEKVWEAEVSGKGALAMRQVTRRDMMRWLETHGFVQEPGKATGHLHFAGPGVKITLPGHGPQDLTKKHVALIIRALERAGFDREQIRRELGVQ